jgi:CBS domain-containing protein
MAQVLVVILDDLSRLETLLNAWKRIGVPGVTLMQSIGGYQAESWLERIGLGGLSRLLEQGEIRQRTLISLIEDDQLLEKAISEADEIIGGFDRPHSGILFAFPVTHTLGTHKLHRAQSVEEAARITENQRARDARLALQRSTRVSQISGVLNLMPIVVKTHTPLQDIVGEFLARPNVHVVSVTDDENLLVGLIDVATLADGLFFTIFPEEFLSELKNLDEALDFAQRTHSRLAEDLMREPIAVRVDDDLEKAFRLMHEHKLSGLPVIDEHYHVQGYVNLLELMAVCLRNLDSGE